ncbi:unnamed protein product [Diatraea saccharalis]|uniref:peptidylprolyl isomerase n=1 Tax=Diatraea saccharalis TaxID=40085 RepID=A0A9N9R6Z1_9NEOP|nr:unnamed protein product [Diatraea saccharalis]
MNSGAPIKIKLGTGRCLPGVEIGVTTVRGPAARFHLLLQPRLAWGPLGAPPRVRPDPALFVISLYDVKDVHAATRYVVTGPDLQYFPIDLLKIKICGIISLFSVTFFKSVYFIIFFVKVKLTYEILSIWQLDIVLLLVLVLMHGLFVFIQF